MKNLKVMLIILVIVLVISNIVFGYMALSKPNGPGRGNFQMPELSDAEKTEVTSVFEANSDSEIIRYCEQNRMNCGYYCRSINQDHEYCKTMMQNMPDRRQNLPSN